MGISTEFLFFWYPRDQAIEDKGFETEDILNFHQWILSIAPSTHTNVIKQMKYLKILGNSFNTYVTPSRWFGTICGALTNSIPTLCSDWNHQ